MKIKTEKDCISVAQHYGMNVENFAAVHGITTESTQKLTADLFTALTMAELWDIHHKVSSNPALAQVALSYIITIAAKNNDITAMKSVYKISAPNSETRANADVGIQKYCIESFAKAQAEKNLFAMLQSCFHLPDGVLKDSFLNIITHDAYKARDIEILWRIYECNYQADILQMIITIAENNGDIIAIKEVAIEAPPGSQQWFYAIALLSEAYTPDAIPAEGSVQGEGKTS